MDRCVERLSILSEAATNKKLCTFCSTSVQSGAFCTKGAGIFARFAQREQELLSVKHILVVGGIVLAVDVLVVGRGLVMGGIFPGAFHQGQHQLYLKVVSSSSKKILVVW